MRSPVFTRDQIRRVDQMAIEEYHIPSLVLMENAGRGAARLIDRLYGASGKSVVIVCGSGNNGGDGGVIARHLHNAGWQVQIVIVRPAEKFSADMTAQYRMISAMNLPITFALEESSFAACAQAWGRSVVVVDAMLGTGFDGEVRSPLAEMISRLNEAEKLGTVAIDVPSGLDCQTGQASAATVRADHTVTFVGPKVGFARGHAGAVLGEVHVVDIGVPAELIERVANAT